MAPWDVIEHTADVGLRATGSNLEQAIGDLVVGFGRLVCPDSRVSARTGRSLVVEAESLRDLIVDLLDELNFVHQTEGFIPAACGASLAKDRKKVSVLARGETYDPERHGHLMEIKAVTLHALKVTEDPPLIEVIFDI